MATIYKTLSKREKGGEYEILIRLRNGNDYDINAKSGVFVTADNFKNGDLVVNRRKIGNDIELHETREKQLRNLESAILNAVKSMDKAEVTKTWLSEFINRHNNPEKYAPVTEQKKDVYALINEYLSCNNFSYYHIKAIRVLARDIARYECFIRSMGEEEERANKKAKEQTHEYDKNFTFDVDKVTADTITDFFDYLKNEKQLSTEYPKLFYRLLKVHPVGMRKGFSTLEARGENTLVKLRKKLKAFFNWLSDTRRTQNRPFDGVKIGTEKYGVPYYITIDERNRIADFDFSDNKPLGVQRDIFVFHCFVGCRVGDLMKLTNENVGNGIMTYCPHKTKDDGDAPILARIPLHPKAVELIKKYHGVDKQGRLFPFISSQKYNEAIKRIFTAVGITRIVIVRDPVTGENVAKPINEIASSHLARRTFVGNAYKKVSDPNIICKMSGHVEGSRAFARYRKIDDDMLKSVIDLIG